MYEEIEDEIMGNAIERAIKEHIYIKKADPMSPEFREIGDYIWGSYSLRQLSKKMGYYIINKNLAAASWLATISNYPYSEICSLPINQSVYVIIRT